MHPKPHSRMQILKATISKIRATTNSFAENVEFSSQPPKPHHKPWFLRQNHTKGRITLVQCSEGSIEKLKESGLTTKIIPRHSSVYVFFWFPDKIPWKLVVITRKVTIIQHFLVPLNTFTSHKWFLLYYLYFFFVELSPWSGNCGAKLYMRSLKWYIKWIQERWNKQHEYDNLNSCKIDWIQREMFDNRPTKRHCPPPQLQFDAFSRK